MNSETVDSLLQTPQDPAARALVARYAPIILFDRNEPFLPLAVGYTIFRKREPSPSFPRQIDLKPGEALAIEYAIWWDWDIGHLYELEHVWVFIDAQGQVSRVEASSHGGYFNMVGPEGLRLEGTHPVLYSEPGKHAFAPDPAWYRRDRSPRIIEATTQRFAGVNGMWVTPLFEAEMHAFRTPEANRLVLSYLQRLAFDPAWEFDLRFPITEAMLVPWPALHAWIPHRVAWWLEKLAREIPPEERRFWRIAHRGASAHAPENTLAAFREAARLGADMVELDVQMTADGVAVVIHDATVDRFPGHAGEIRFKTLAEIQLIDAGRGERIPTLEEAIQVCREDLLGMYIELKTGSAIEPVARAFREHDLYQWALVGAFRPDWVAEIKRLDPRIRTAILFHSPHIDPVALARAVNADFVHPCWENAAPQPHALLTREWVQRVRDAGLGIILWHEERPDEIAAIRKMGVDGICSDAPELLR
ncbi:MAG TPA: hypothetical protein EYP25_04515 [Anaerolineae bacterium]|nr:hypothetical protein [Caldilineae bacterium]HID33822.1 hypothetical protein [Anaerolineae bacterium]HIQ11887.1 hypothetical protein [Caldilineales bacterium]